MFRFYKKAGRKIYSFIRFKRRKSATGNFNAGRQLTVGEIALAREIYKNSIRYRDVKIHRGKYFFKQPPGSGMTPNGEIYVTDDPKRGNFLYKDDYSRESLALKAFFIHEMAHVWQYQNNILRVKTTAILGQLRHLGKYNKMYKYTLEARKHLFDYGIEQQAAIIEDYYIVVKENMPEFCAGRIQNQCTPAEKKELLEKVIASFILYPTFPSNKDDF